MGEVDRECVRDRPRFEDEVHERIDICHIDLMDSLRLLVSSGGETNEANAAVGGLSMH